MNRILILLTFIFVNQVSYSQSRSEKIRFADKEPLIVRYRLLSKKAWDNNNEKLAYTYDDSIANCITHSYIDNYKFETMDNRIYDVGKTKKPIFLTVSATWCLPCRAEIPALNKIVDEYANRVDFLVLFWDEKKELDSLSKQYNPKIYLIPSKTKSVDSEHTIDIAGFRNITGYPTMFFVSENKQIMAYETGAFAEMSFVDKSGKNVTITSKDAYDNNYKRLKGIIEGLLNKTDADRIIK
jgi:thiol-disulfide isomerase/thioredoxin